MSINIHNIVIAAGKISSDISVAEAADVYANCSVKIFPVHGTYNNNCTCGKQNCEKQAKHPVFKDWQKLATNDLNIITSWWEKYPFANIGMPTGEINNTIVIDSDVLDNEYLKKFEAILPGFSRTLKSLTGRGEHVFFRYPNEPLKNIIGLLQNLDLKSNGGYVILPPSRHISGRTYKWVY